jgi:malonyl-CoA O-methyltransferase
MIRWPFGRRVAAAEKVAPEHAYALWAPTYPPHPHNRLMEIEQHAVLALLPEVQGLTALDAGCGSGRYLRELSARGATAIGVDLSSEMLDRARQFTLRVARADLRALPFDEMTIDLVVCALALGDIADLELALAEFARVLRPSGRVIYSVVHPDGEAAGWSRTFQSNGRQWAVDGYWHSLVRHRSACEAAALAIDAWREPALENGQRAALVVRAIR